MRPGLQLLATAAAGGAAVAAAFWLVESVLPQAVSISLEAGGLARPLRYFRPVVAARGLQ